MLDHLTTDRRTLLQHTLLLAGAVSMSGCSYTALAAEAASPGRFLSASPYAALEAYADVLIPQTANSGGAIAAKVPQAFDALLRGWASAGTKDQVNDALSRLDAAAQAAHGKPLAQITPDERVSFLREYDRAALQNVPPPPGAKSSNPFAPLVSVADGGYHKLKQLVINLYYSSEIALTLETPYEHVPGEWVPSLKITPGMRAFASGGPF